MSIALKFSSGDSERTHERYGTWEKIIPLPPDGLLWSVGGASLELFLVVADAWTQAMSPYIQPGATVLDIGCGCGRSARALVPHPCVAQYTGFDVIAENVDWCRKHIEPFAGGRARFLYYDLYSAEYNPNGALKASDLAFPCETGSVDLVIAASLFTHLLEVDAIHYLQQISRVLSRRGYALLSIHTQVQDGENFGGTEARIDINPSYFLKLSAEAGLKLVSKLDDLCGQTLFVFSAINT